MKRVELLDGSGPMKSIDTRSQDLVAEMRDDEGGLKKRGLVSLQAVQLSMT